jgi:hypothetical protein
MLAQQDRQQLGPAITKQRFYKHIKREEPDWSPYSILLIQITACKSDQTITFGTLLVFGFR